MVRNVLLSVCHVTLVTIGMAASAWLGGWSMNAAAQPVLGENQMMQKKFYFAQLLGTRPGWPERMTADEERVMGEHFEYLKRLVGEKKVLMAGPVMEPVFGLIVLAVGSEQEARQVMDNEPSVVAGVHTYELHPMHVSLLADYQSSDRYVAEPTDAVLRKQVTVSAPLDAVWEAWTTTAGIETFFAPKARVELRLGGPYEVYFAVDAPRGSQGSEDCRVLSYLPKEMLAFEWNAPPDFGDLRRKRTQVMVTLVENEPGRVIVTLAQSGWGKGAEWNRLYAYFDRAWGNVLENLAKRFLEGPINWSGSE